MWDRAVKYYDNLRLVIEIQSRLKEWTDQEQAQNTSPARKPGDRQTEGSKKAESSGQGVSNGQKPEAGTDQKKR